MQRIEISYIQAKINSIQKCDPSQPIRVSSFSASSWLIAKTVLEEAKEEGWEGGGQGRILCNITITLWLIQITVNSNET